MDIKLKTSEMLLTKLSFGNGEAQLQAVAEIRLFSKWDDANRVSLARAGAIAPLLELLDQSTDARVRENAVAALLNMSINPENKVRMVREKGGLEVVMQVANPGGSGDAGASGSGDVGFSGSGGAKVSAAALLYSLVLDDEVRRIVGSNESLWTTLVSLLRDGSSKCKAEALKALFIGAGDDQIREKLLQERHQLISLLLSMVTVGKVKLTEDCLAVLASLASCAAGAKAVMDTPTSVSVLLYLISSGTPRAQENAVSVFLNVCQNDTEAQEMLPLKTLIPALNDLCRAGSERGKAKAESLLSLLGFEEPLYFPSDPNSNFNYGWKPNTMPVFPTRPQHPPPSPQTNPSASSTSTHFPNASKPKSFSNNKFINLAKNLFTHRPRKKSHTPIT